VAVTDAVALPGGRMLLSAAAEDTPNSVDDGPVVGAALALVRDDDLLALAALPAPAGPSDDGLLRIGDVRDGKGPLPARGTRPKPDETTWRPDHDGKKAAGTRCR
jgi:hypothetical protein